MSNSIQPSPATGIAEAGYVHGTLASVFDAQFVEGPEWQQFTASWDNLRQDGYMADGGTYRERRYSEFSYRADTEQVTWLPHVAYSQPLYINHLNGGIERHFEPFEQHVAEGPVLRSIFQWCAGTLARSVGAADWKIQTFQNRILARGEEAGQPTPEGLHRDGVDHVLTLLIGRNSIEGGVSAVYDAESRDCLGEVLLSESGEFLFADDERLLHSVTPVTPAVPGVPGHRDVLIAMFTRTDS
ncbi:MULTISPECIES: 2OG-Fe dioxygenase family protein [Kitasatospora]|uniref:2OG-Fe dioxygenase family protein n=1 Tax=Kitasatospora cystarginea TaxID=58350 RepID=A0ABN3DR58_9ACTN